MPSDEALYERLLAGDLGAFDALYERYERPLFGFVRRHLADAAEAEDVLHDTFLALLRSGDEGRSTRSFRAWIYQVARNLCFNRLRSRRRAIRAIEKMARSPEPPAEEPEHALLERESAEAFRRAVARLPTPLGELYALRAGGLSYAEVAEVLAVPLGTVKSRMHDMVGRLREEMSS
jgi:RNA polymerase sigma factor (sigma-70 family)